VNLDGRYDPHSVFRRLGYKAFGLGCPASGGGFGYFHWVQLSFPTAESDLEQRFNYESDWLRRALIFFPYSVSCFVVLWYIIFCSVPFKNEPITVSKKTIKTDEKSRLCKGLEEKSKGRLNELGRVAIARGYKSCRWYFWWSWVSFPQMDIAAGICAGQAYLNPCC